MGRTRTKPQRVPTRDWHRLTNEQRLRALVDTAIPLVRMCRGLASNPRLSADCQHWLGVAVLFASPARFQGGSLRQP